MAKRSLRFGVHDEEDHRAATWKLWTETSGSKSEVYLACRSLGGSLKVSLHESGRWHIAYTQPAFEASFPDAIVKSRDRFIEKWPRPTEIAPGVTLAFRIVTPYSAITKTKEKGRFKGVIWLPNAPVEKATEIGIVITSSTTPVVGWPGKRAMNNELIGLFQLNNGDIVWAVYRIIDMPDLSSITKRNLNFYKGKSEKDLEKGGLRALVFGKEPDGSRVIYDCAVQGKII